MLEKTPAVGLAAPTACLPRFLQVNGDKCVAAPLPSPRPGPQRSPPREGAEGGRHRAAPRPAGLKKDGRKAGLKPSPGRGRGGGLLGLSWTRVAPYLVARANYAPEKLLSQGLRRSAAVKCPGNVFLRRLRERREEQGEAPHLSREIREMPEPRDAGCHYHTALQKPLCPLCEERLCAKIKKDRKKYQLNFHP